MGWFVSHYAHAANGPACALSIIEAQREIICISRCCWFLQLGNRVKFSSEALQPVSRGQCSDNYYKTHYIKSNKRLKPTRDISSTSTSTFQEPLHAVLLTSMFEFAIGNMQRSPASAHFKFWSSNSRLTPTLVIRVKRPHINLQLMLTVRLETCSCVDVAAAGIADNCDWMLAIYFSKTLYLEIQMQLTMSLNLTKRRLEHTISKL